MKKTAADGGEDPTPSTDLVYAGDRNLTEAGRHHFGLAQMLSAPA